MKKARAQARAFFISFFELVLRFERRAYGRTV
jgi:hypothetical protein